MRRSLALLSLLGATLAPGAEAQSGGWIKAGSSQVRLAWCDGWKPPASSGATALAFLEIRLEPGWKTYWRNPGDAGVSLSATWDKSENLAAASVLFPAPQRFTDASGETLGYKDQVVLPIRIQATDAAKPTRLKASVNYGICSNICVPVDVELTGACHDTTINADVARSVEAVPRAPGQRRASDPALVAVSGSVVAAPQMLSIDVDFGAGASGGDLFLEAPEGLFVPQAKRATIDAKGRARFSVDLSKSQDAKDLIGKELRLTMTSAKGASEAFWVAK